MVSAVVQSFLRQDDQNHVPEFSQQEIMSFLVIQLDKGETKWQGYYLVATTRPSDLQSGQSKTYLASTLAASGFRYRCFM